MATNPKKITLFNKVTKQQLNTLAGGTPITKGSDTLTPQEGVGYLIPDTSVSFEAQNLSTAEKTQARTNIGAGTSNFSGSYNDLTDKPTLPATTTAGQIVKTTSTSGTFTSGNSLPYLTTAPSADNTDGGLILVFLSADPATKYSGYLYFIEQSNS